MGKYDIKAIQKKLRDCIPPEAVQFRKLDNYPHIPIQVYIRYLNDIVPDWEKRVIRNTANIQAGYCEAVVEVTIAGVSREGYGIVKIRYGNKTKEILDITWDMRAAVSDAIKDVLENDWEMGKTALLPHLINADKQWASNPSVVRKEKPEKNLPKCIVCHEELIDEDIKLLDEYEEQDFSRGIKLLIDLGYHLYNGGIKEFNLIDGISNWDTANYLVFLQACEIRKGWA